MAVGGWESTPLWPRNQHVLPHFNASVLLLTLGKRFRTETMNIPPGLFAPRDSSLPGTPGMRAVDLPAKFSFIWMDIHFHGSIQFEERNGGRPWLTLSGNLGPVPFTAEDVGRRGRMFALGDAAIVENAHFEVSADADIQFIHGAEVPEPVTEMAVLGQTAALLAEAKHVSGDGGHPSREIPKNRDVFASPTGGQIPQDPAWAGTRSLPLVDRL